MRMGEALSLVYLRLLRVYLVYALAAGAYSVPRDVSVYAVFRSRLIIPFDFYFLMFAHKIWRGGLKPHPLPCQAACSRTDEKNSAGLTIFSPGRRDGAEVIYTVHSSPSKVTRSL